MTKSTYLIARVTPEERARVAAQAKALGVSVSELLRQAVGLKPPASPSARSRATYADPTSPWSPRTRAP